jgi:hypothetical protein
LISVLCNWNSNLDTCQTSFFSFYFSLIGLRTITVCLQFPANYPQEPIVIELKSKTLPEKVCYKITKICEEEAKKWQGQRQVLTDLINLHYLYTKCSLQTLLVRIYTYNICKAKYNCQKSVLLYAFKLQQNCNYFFIYCVVCRKLIFCKKKLTLAWGSKYYFWNTRK